jgi:hypothetical protein
MFLNQSERINGAEILAPVLGGEQKESGVEKSRPALELGLWLRALRSFFNSRNHPLGDAELAGIMSRDFKGEAQIAREALSRCSHLIFILSQPESQPQFYDAEEIREVDSALRVSGADEYSFDRPNGSLNELAETIRDACNLGHALLRAPALGFAAWASFGNILLRQLNHSEAARELVTHSIRNDESGLQQKLRNLTEPLEPEEFGSDMLAVFTLLTGLLEHLRLIEKSLLSDLPLKQTLPIFTLVREDARGLLELIENRGLHVKGLGENILGALDGTAYAIRMELRKAFEHELVGLCALRQPPQIYARVENAHGLLRDCFQQSIVALAQIFDARLEGRHLFSAFETRLEQSLALRADLWAILDQVRAFDKEGDERGALAPLLARLNAFRDGSLRYLMYKDWEACERFVEELGATRGAAAMKHLLHRFEAFLETLFGQVNMRAVLADHPFTPGVIEA